MCHSLQWKGASVTLLCKTESTPLVKPWSTAKVADAGFKIQMQEPGKLPLVISDEGYAKPRDQVTIESETVGTLTYSHFLYSLRLIIWPDGKKPGLIDCTQRNWENSCSLCFLQVMRLIRGGGIITNFRGSFPALGDRACRQNILWKI